MQVGGREFDSSKQDVEKAMSGETPESLQKYAVTINGLNYPPKQVLAKMTGWERSTFTTMEAQRVLKKLGFESYDISVVQTGRRTFTPSVIPESEEASFGDRLAAVEAALAVAQEAIVGLGARLRVLEA